MCSRCYYSTGHSAYSAALSSMYSNIPGGAFSLFGSHPAIFGSNPNLPFAGLSSFGDSLLSAAAGLSSGGSLDTANSQYSQHSHVYTSCKFKVTFDSKNKRLNLVVTSSALLNVIMKGLTQFFVSCYIGVLISREGGNICSIIFITVFKLEVLTVTFENEYHCIKWQQLFFSFF